MSSGTELKKLSDLRVVDLKNELEKLGLEKNGIKAVLIERLQKALIGKGLNPDEYLFEVSNRQKRKLEGDRTTDDSVNCDDDSEKDGPDGSDSMIVTDELGDEEGSTEDSRTHIVISETEEKSNTEETSCNMSESIPNSCSSLNGDNNSSTNMSSAEFSSKIDGRENTDKVPDGNTVDNEDSINLDITEEEKLMTEEEKGLADEEDDRRKEAEKVDKGKENSSEETVKKEEIKNEEESQQKNSVTEASGLVKAEEETIVEEAKEIKEDDKTKSEEASAAKAEPEGKAIKDKKNEITESRNLWVSNLSSHTRATDLKQVFSKHGKVIGAKVVTNARTPGARCYGYVTMANSDDATRCIKHLHRIELHGRMISVEKAKGDATGPLRTGSRRSDTRPHERRRTTSRHDSSRDKKSEDKKKPENGEAKPKSEGNAEENRERTGDEKCEPDGDKRGSDEKCRSEKSKSKDRNRSKSVRSHGHRSVHSRSPFRRRHSPRKDVLSFSQIKEERERQRLREKERRIREEAKRRREEALRQRDIDRRQKSEAARLEREREKLRLERERIEREKSELLRMERERQRLERERLEREKEELKMQQKRLEAARRSSKRPTDDRRDFPDKRPALVRSHFDAPPPPRFTEEDRRRERFERERDRERDRDRDRDRDRERDRDRPSTGYRARDERRTVDDHRERSSVDWHSGSSQQSSKTFGNIGGPSGTTSRDPWGSSDRKSDSNASWGRTDGNPGESRWVNNVSNMSILGRPPMGNAIATALYQNQPVPPGLGMGISLSSNGPYSNDRGDWQRRRVVGYYYDSRVIHPRRESYVLPSEGEPC